jgi:hypothetical protein
MNRATPEILDLSQRLIAFEARSAKSSKSSVPAAFPVCEKLRPHLATLTGRGGFHALLSRALAMARGEVDWLSTVGLTEEGALSVSDEGVTKVDAKALAEGSMVLVAQLLGLLVAFIGEKLALRIVREIWPKLPLDDPGDQKK